MNGSRITYATHPDSTPEAELDALCFIYRAALDKQEKAAGTNGGSNDAEKGINDESGTETSIPQR